ncbi:MAG TPA: ACT domain-containing protein [Burkholderiaceae bacterium]|nr:ACT domain-containing protein [Burkholderiaceae bacterium]
MHRLADAPGPLLRALNPRHQPGVYAFVSAPESVDLAALQPVATFRESEGLTLVVEEARALAAGLPVRFRAAWLTLTVASGLHDVGLTAAVTGALAEAGIACNVVAAVHHDHLFVPAEQVDAALAALDALQRGAVQQA